MSKRTRIHPVQFYLNDDEQYILPLPALPKQPFLTLNTLWIIHMTAEIRTIQIRHFI